MSHYLYSTLSTISYFKEVAYLDMFNQFSYEKLCVYLNPFKIIPLDPTGNALFFNTWWPK